MRSKRDEKYTTIRTVADEAGVSIATVSRVINGGIVKERNKKKVMDAIKKLNYVPNASARNLASVTTTKRIVLLVPDIGKSYYRDLIYGYQSVLETYAYDSVIEPYYYNVDILKKFSESVVLSSEYKGIITLGKNLVGETKLGIDWFTTELKYKVPSEKNGLYTTDEYLGEYLRQEFNLENVDKSTFKNQKKIIAPSLEDALYVYNNIDEEQIIYTFDNVDEISKIIPNIKKITFDFYGLGAALARLTIKKIKEEKIDNEIIFQIRGLDEV